MKFGSLLSTFSAWRLVAGQQPLRKLTTYVDNCNVLPGLDQCCVGDPTPDSNICINLSDNWVVNKGACRGISESSNGVIYGVCAMTSNKITLGVTIGSNSCRDGQLACYDMGAGNGNVLVGNESCVGQRACEVAGHGTVSVPRTTVTIGHKSCVGGESCHALGDTMNGNNDVTVKVGDGSCTGHKSCVHAGASVTPWKGFHIGVHFEVGHNSCRGKYSCSKTGTNGKAIIGNDSCVGSYACQFQNDSSLGKTIAIGKNSCHCQSCCQCLNDGDRVPDNMCNDLGSGTNHCCTQAGIDQFRNSAFNFSSSSPLTLPGATLLPTSSPTKKVNDYEVLLKSTIFNKDDKIEVLYSVTDIDKISDMSFKIYKTGCIEEIDDTSIQAVGKSYDGSTAEAEITLTKENLSVSGYATAGSSDNVGEVDFCVKAETYEMIGTDRISASFLSKNFKIKYDLSSNSFTVGTMDIEALGLGDTDVGTIETEYDIKADRCDPDGTPTGLKLFQTSLLHICIEPVASDIKIDHFEMSFYQTINNMNVEQFKAIAPNSVTNGLTSISGDGIKNSPKIVTSRLISKLFEDGRTTFTVKGVVSLKFIANHVNLQRSLENLMVSDRQLQNDQGTVNSSFSLDIELEKYSNTSAIKNESTTFTVVAVFGGCLTISIVFILFKKMNST